MLRENLSMPRGDSREYRLEVTDENENVFNITGATVLFTVKKLNSDADPGEFQLTSTNPAEILLDDPGNGGGRIFIENPHTQDMEIRSYIYDCQVQPVDGGVKTVVGGAFTLTEDATRTV